MRVLRVRIVPSQITFAVHAHAWAWTNWAGKGCQRTCAAELLVLLDAQVSDAARVRRVSALKSSSSRHCLNPCTQRPSLCLTHLQCHKQVDHFLGW